MKTYKELKAVLKATQVEHDRMQQADDRYCTNGGHDRGVAAIKAARDALNAVTIDMTGKTDVEILVEFLKVAETATTHDDFMETGHSFPDRDCLIPGKVVNYGLTTWIANLFNANSAALLDGVQRVIDAMPDFIFQWTVTGIPFDGVAGATLIITPDKPLITAQAITPAIALTSAILQAMVAHPKPVIKKLPGL